MKKNFTDDIFEDIKVYEQILQKEENKKVYNMNLLDEIHANENAHSRILTKLLNYKFNGQFYFLNSFILSSINHSEIFSKYLNDNPKTVFNWAYIDIYISFGYGTNKYGIIIENKINWAKDQEKQIERYVEELQNHGINQDKIFVIYLTDTGIKEVTTDSLTDKATKLLRDNERFLPKSYLYDVLPWLENDVIPVIPYKEKQLYAALEQYIDYLKGRFGLRTTDKDFNEAVMKDIIEALGLKGKTDEEVLSRLDDYSNKINSFREEIQKIHQSKYINSESTLNERISNDFFKQYTQYAKTKGYGNFWYYNELSFFATVIDSVSVIKIPEIKDFFIDVSCNLNNSREWTFTLSSRSKRKSEEKFTEKQIKIIQEISEFTMSDDGINFNYSKNFEKCMKGNITPENYQDLFEELWGLEKKLLDELSKE